MAPHKKQYGQFFTTDSSIQELVRHLTKNRTGLVLEPSAGAGDLLSLDPKDARTAIAIEYDPALALSLGHKHAIDPTRIVYGGCFFELITNIPGPVATVLSNPPYVSLTHYQSAASQGLTTYLAQHKFSGKTNLAFPFMLASAELLAPNGEMIFIVPKDFASATSAEPLRAYLQKFGSITHWVDAGEVKHFPDADLETLVIWRWQKTLITTPVSYASSVAKALSGQWTPRAALWSGAGSVLFLTAPKITKLLANQPHTTIGDYFDILVGSVTGLDKAFLAPAHLHKYAYAKKFQVGLGAPKIYLDTNKYLTEASLPKALLKHLLPFKSSLKKRFQCPKNAWWQWATVRNATVSLSPSGLSRIFVLAQTRQDPFFLGQDIGFAGSIYALFPKDKNLDPSFLAEAVRILNHPTYKELYKSGGLGVNDKFRCAPKALSQVPFPSPALWSEFLR